uniref:EC72 protein n=1 Tax=Colletotrichum higginsianum TaxID=80884 RepID=I2G7F2_9PEZI|nr:EC72 protein [Colletotrichum higginsianum]
MLVWLGWLLGSSAGTATGFILSSRLHRGVGQPVDRHAKG